MRHRSRSHTGQSHGRVCGSGGCSRGTRRSMVPRYLPHSRRRPSGASRPRAGCQRPCGHSRPHVGRRRRAAQPAPPTTKGECPMSINKYVCTGRLTRDPELRSLPSGTTVCELRIAVDGMGRGYEVGYLNVSVFGNGGAAAAEHLSKGWLVAVEGRLEFAEWETDGGEKRHDYT